MKDEEMFDSMLVRQSDPSLRLPVQLMNEPVAGNSIAFRHDHSVYSTMKRNYGTDRVQIMSVEKQTVQGAPIFLVEFEPLSGKTDRE